MIMGDGFRSRRWIALVAAYVVGLQAVLLPLSVAAAGPFSTNPCSAHAANGGTPPVNGQNGCPCAAGCGALCCAPAILAPEPVIAAIEAREFGPTPTPRLLLASLARAPDWCPQAPRGPPVV